MSRPQGPGATCIFDFARLSLTSGRATDLGQCGARAAKDMLSDEPQSFSSTVAAKKTIICLLRPRPETGQPPHGWSPWRSRATSFSATKLA